MVRRAHPYHMYDHILSSPRAFGDTARRVLDEEADFARDMSRHRRLYLAGIGTSHHATLMAQYLLRPLEDTRSVRSVHSMDFCLFPPPVGTDTCLVTVSHRGSKGFSVRATQLVRERGGLTALVTGQGDDPPNAAYADRVIRTVPQEQSSAHTMSFFGSMGALSALARLVCQSAGVAPPVADTTLTEEVPLALEAALHLEGEASRLASRHLLRRRIWLLGAGPGAVLAREIALKIKETSYILADGMSVEELMHGPFQAAEPDDLFVMIAPDAPGTDRIRAFSSQVEAIGAPMLILTDHPEEWDGTGEAETLKVPALPSPFWALASQIPLLLFTYHLALAKGTDPDGFRLEDKRFLEASQRVPL